MVCTSLRCSVLFSRANATICCGCSVVSLCSHWIGCLVRISEMVPFKPCSHLCCAQEAIDKQKEKEQKKYKAKTLQGLQQDAQKRAKQFEKKVSCVSIKTEHLHSLQMHMCMCVDRFLINSPPLAVLWRTAVIAYGVHTYVCMYVCS